jgi:glycosyltransferase involved in cell wall biosynthesis
MHLKIGLVTSTINDASIISLSNYRDILLQISTLYIITGYNARILFNKNDEKQHSYVRFIDYPFESDLILKTARYLIGQLIYTFYLFKFSKKAENWIFFTGGERMIIPVLSARLLKRKVFLFIPGSAMRDAKFSKDPFLVPIKIISMIVHYLADHIILYSPNLIGEWNLEKHRQKIIIAHEHHININLFNITIPLLSRPFHIGYIGRLSEEKGVQNFVQALPAIFCDQKNLHVFIGGDGQLKESITASLHAENLINQVELKGWISHADLPRYMNQLRLIVLPSYTEGLPNIILEAMACGTPVLTTPVGAIPDIIIDGNNGFIMKDNSPKCIVENVKRALNYPDTDQIVKNGRQFIKNNYTIEQVITRWKEVFEEI